MARYDNLKHSNAFHLEKESDTKSRFYTKTGWLSPYALACGYIECQRVIHTLPGGGHEDVRVTLERDSACIHIKASGRYTRIWESFDTLTEARKFFKKTLRELGGN